MPGEYLDPSRWPLWMQSAALGPLYPRNRTFGPDDAMPTQNVSGLLDGLKNVGGHIADRFNNPPDGLSMMGTAWQAYRDPTALSRAFIKDPSERSASWLRPVRPLAPTTRQKSEDRLGEFLGAIKKAAIGDPNATVQVSVDESGRPLHTLSLQEFSERYPGQTHPIVEAGNILSAGAVTGGMPFAVRNALGMTGGRLPPNNVTRLSLERARRQAHALEHAKRQGYADEPFYLGRSSGPQPTEFPQGKTFWRSQRAARSEGATATDEYRLDLGNLLDLTADRMKAGDLARIISALNATHPNLAEQWVKATVPRYMNPTVEDLIIRANARPNCRLDEPAIDLVSTLRAFRVNHEPIFVNAGYDAYDFGAGVKKLTGAGIRSANASFDPLKRYSHNIMASIPLAGAVAWPLLTVDPDQEER